MSNAMILGAFGTPNCFFSPLRELRTASIDVCRLAVMRNTETRCGVVPVLDVTQSLIIHAQTESHGIGALEAVDDNLLGLVQLICFGKVESSNQSTAAGC